MSDKNEKSGERKSNGSEDRANLNSSDSDRDKNKSDDSSQKDRTSLVENGQKKESITKSAEKTRPSHIYVLKQDSRSNKRTCHLPRTASVDVTARRKLIIASILCLIFMIVEIIGGFFSSSLAIAADAAHTLTDFAGFMISLFAIWLAGRNPTDRLSFGWYRAEVIGAFLSILLIWSVTAVLVYLAIQRIITRDFEINSIIMLLTAGYAIISNMVMGIQLAWGTSKKEINCEPGETITMMHKSAHDHHHSHGVCGSAIDKLNQKFHRLWRKIRRRNTAPRVTISGECVQQQMNMNVRAAILHVIGDMLQSIGVLISALIIYFRPDWAIADPICTFIFAIIVLFTTIKVLKDILLVLMEGTPTFVDYSAVQEVFEKIDGVKSVHGLRIWALSIDRVAMAVHLVIEYNADSKVILAKAEEAIHSRYHLYETTIQIEEDDGAKEI